MKPNHIVQNESRGEFGAPTPHLKVRELVEAVAGPRSINDTRKSWLRRAARLAGTTYRQAKALFYSEISDPHHPTVTKFKKAAGNYEARNLAEQFERMAVALDHRDSDFHSPEIAALLGAARRFAALIAPEITGPTNRGSK